MSNIQLVENLRRLRADHNYTQKEISDRLNISRQAYSNYETGKRVPDIDTLMRLAEIYHVTFQQLITQPCTGRGVLYDSKGPYTPGMVIDTADTIYLSREETVLVTRYRGAGADERHLVRKVLNMTEAAADEQHNT